MLLVMMVSMSASADYDKEITFRGLPMGSSIEEVRTKLLEDGINPSYFKVDENDTVEGFFSDHYEEKYPYIAVDDGGYGVLITNTGDLKLAGYELYYLSLEFMYEIVDGIPVKTQENAGLTRAYYSIEAIDQLAVYADLKQKLTNLYGTPVENREKTRYSNDDDEIQDLAIWFGANDTAVYLTCEWKTQDGITKIPTDYIGDSNVYVYYGKTNTYEAIEQLEKYEERLAYEAEQKLIEDSAEDTTGL